jgi:hypothetical protein
MITITITGVPEIIGMFDSIISKSSDNSNAVLTDVSNFMVNQAKTNAHVITGNMKNSIGASVADKSATVSASAEYSVYENARAGSKWGTTHDFMDRAVDATIQEIPSILSKHSYKWAGKD